MEFTAPWHTAWGDGSSINDGPRAEWHLDLSDDPNTATGIARFAESGGYPLMRCAEIWTLSALNPGYPTFGAATVFDLVVDDATDPDVDDEDGTAGAFLVRQMSGGGWPYVGGGMVIRRGGTIQTTGPTGLRGDAVLSFYNSKGGLPLSHMAVDPFGCAHFFTGPSLDSLSYSSGPVEPNPYRPGGDAIAELFASPGIPAAVIFNYFPTAPLSFSPNVRIDVAGRMYADPSTFTEFHYYSPVLDFVEPDVGDALVLSDDGEVDTSSSASQPGVVGLYVRKDRTKNVQNSVTGEVLADYWWDPVEECVVDWSTYTFDPDNPPELIKPDPEEGPELVQVASVGDNRVFSDMEGTAALEGFNVVAEGGDIEVGDLLCTSSTPGKLMKQADDVVHSYTVGKALQAVDFDGGAPSPTYGVYGIILCG